MSMLRRYRAPSTGHLLAQLLESSELATRVQELPSASLAKVIDHIGLEDAGDLVALASRKQLRDVFDEDLWKSDESAIEERFDAQRFALWLAILGEGGDDFIARCLSEMPEDLLTLGVQRLILVLDMDALSERLSGDEESAQETENALSRVVYEEWEEFAFVARDPSTWDVVWNSVLTLDRDHHELLRRVLERCAAVTQTRLDDEEGLYNLLSEEELLEGEAFDARDERRTSQGYVSPADARAFLKLSRTQQDWTGRDAITLAYFRQLAPTTAEARGAGKASTAAKPVLGAGQVEKGEEAMKRLLQEAGAMAAEPIIQSDRMLGTSREDDKPISLKKLLAKLRDRDASCAGQRLEEITYLATVLLSAAPKDASRRPIDALQGAMAVVERGLSAWLSSTSLRHPPSQEQKIKILENISADLLFRRGVHTLQSAPPPTTSNALTPWLSVLMVG